MHSETVTKPPNTVKTKTALVVVQSLVARDPRVIRQIDWLTSSGWEVDSLGLGPVPSSAVATHFEMAPLPSWNGFKLLKLAAIHAFLPFRSRFVKLRQSLFPSEVSQKVASGYYDLIIFNDIHLLPWMSDPQTFPPLKNVAQIHIDIHEWFPAEISRATTRAGFLMQGYHTWMRNHIAHPLVNTRSLAADAVDLYQRDFDIPSPVIVRNAPPFVDQEPSIVGPGPIRLLHHGVAAFERGLGELIEAMHGLDDRFSLTFMLVGQESTIEKLKALAQPLGSRVTFVPPAPMTQLAQEINEYDVEVMFYPPTSVNLQIAFPNKFFEAIQGRLAMVVGPTKSMADIIERERCGVVTDGWRIPDLIAALNSLTEESVTAMKQRSHAIAAQNCAESERSKFFESIGFPES
jgi:glycosyltransferase involved in cell wall biosynthesis